MYRAGGVGSPSGAGRPRTAIRPATLAGAKSPAKKRHTPLTADEHKEFAQLQELACERAAPFDRDLRSTMNHF
jgi:hypothetical protein